jgi:hypothetical protein
LSAVVQAEEEAGVAIFLQSELPRDANLAAELKPRWAR